IGSGGSAGLEGPSLQIGGTIGSAVASKAKLSTMDRRILMLSGAAAGISAAFRAPLTGAIFAMEVPYKNDLEHEAAVPALISSVTSYITFILILGSEPLFKTSRISFTFSDVPLFILQGVFSAVVSLAFVVVYNKIGDMFHRLRIPIAVKAGIGGLMVGLIGGISPYVLGVGYPGIQHILNRDFSLEYVVMLLILKIFATSFTLGSGGNGGVFIPTVFIGAASGAIYGMAVAPNKLVIFETLGMASVLAASSKVPIAAVAFVAETTTPTYIIPAIIASTVSYLVSGSVSLYSHQQLVKPTLADATVGEIMEEKFVTVDARSSLEDVAKEVFRHHHKVFPVISGDRLVGVISISDMMKIPRENWRTTLVSEAMSKKRILTATSDQAASEIVAAMGKRGIAMVPVVDSKKSAKLVGVIYRYDILHAIEEYRLE
ncbi:MAG: chloride channel protein, partial [Candidatus Bathyarchaeia archaeon]